MALVGCFYPWASPRRWRPVCCTSLLPGPREHWDLERQRDLPTPVWSRDGILARLTPMPFATAHIPCNSSHKNKGLWNSEGGVRPCSSPILFYRREDWGSEQWLMTWVPRLVSPVIILSELLTHLVPCLVFLPSPSLTALFHSVSRALSRAPLYGLPPFHSTGQASPAV